MAFRGGLGIELYEPVSIGPLRIEEMTWSLPGVTFPVDLGGGVRAFQHRRGLLQRLELSIGLSDLEAWLTKQLSRPSDPTELGGLIRPVALWPLSDGLGVGVFAERGVVAADLLWCPTDLDGGFVVSNPRGVLEQLQPALSSVLFLIARALGETQTHDGRVVRLPAVPKKVLKALLPSLGFRLPEVGRVRCGGLEFRADRLHVVFDRGLPPWSMPASVTRAWEFAALAAAGDRALVAGDWSTARHAYVAALEQAPRHPELSQTIAAIDVHFEERAEAALGLLVESLPAVEFGLVGAELLAKTGDTEGARLAVAKLVNHERFPPLSAAYWVKLSEWLTNSTEKAEVIELALACSAASATARWARFHSRVQLGDVHGAVADAEHLEAGARGSEAKHAVLLRCAQELNTVGFVDAAAKLFERALRYVPGDARASLGVALGLVAAGKFARATVVLQRTLDTENLDEAVQAEAHLTLARLLAEHAGDLPAAIARVRRASGLTKTAVEARGYEAVWRAKLGDVAGATLAFSRLHEVIASSPEVTAHRAGYWLFQAGKFALEQAGDPFVAERFLGFALRRLPKDTAIAEAYRVAAAQVARRPRLDASPAASYQDEPQDRTAPADYARAMPRDDEWTLAHEHSSPLADVHLEGVSPLAAPFHEAAEGDAAVVPEQTSSSDTPASESPESGDEFALDRRVDGLKAQLMASSQISAEVLEELVRSLGKLDRLEEAYALLRAQYDDSEGETRARFKEALLGVLSRLVDWSLARDRADDAELYGMTRDALESE